MTIDPSELEALYKRDVERLCASRSYRDVKEAAQYVELKIAPVWRPLLGLRDRSVLLTKQLKFAPTMTLLMQLFGRGVHERGRELQRFPRMHHFRALPDKSSGGCRTPRAIAKSDIARIIGKSKSAVDHAFTQFRARHDELYEDLFVKELCLPLPVETGLMLDMALHPQISFAFETEEYEEVLRAANERRINDMDTSRKVHMWCTRALGRGSKPAASAPTAYPETTTNSEQQR